MHAVGILGCPRRISDYADQFVGYSASVVVGLLGVLIGEGMQVGVMLVWGMRGKAKRVELGGL